MPKNPILFKGLSSESPCHFEQGTLLSQFIANRLLRTCLRPEVNTGNHCLIGIERGVVTDSLFFKSQEMEGRQMSAETSRAIHRSKRRSKISTVRKLGTEMIPSMKNGSRNRTVSSLWSSYERFLHNELSLFHLEFFRRPRAIEVANTGHRVQEISANLYHP